ncbi:MAG: hypothetical protein IKJ91_06845 [Clostridia bacterium]|nr:hypothetical protein [Clostridia bacterium]
MNWKNIKFFLIILLLVVNIFLAVMLIGRTSIKVYDKEATENISELLSESGIFVDKKFLNIKDKDSKVYACNIESDYSAKIASKLMGEYEEAFATPYGAEFFAKDSFLKIDEDFQFSYSKIGFSLQEPKNDMTDDEVKLLKEKLAKLLGTDFKLISAKKQDSAEYALVMQTFDEKSIENHTLECYFDGDTPVYVDGKWCFLSIDESFSAHTLDSVNILFIEKSALDLSKEKNEVVPQKLTVKDMSICYCSHISLDGSKLYLMPSWRIQWVEDGINDTYYNAVNGEKNIIPNLNIN